MGLVKHFRQFIQSSNGAAAVEVALLAPVYLGALFGIFEIGRIMLITVLLEGGIHSAAQDIYSTTNNINSSTDNLVKVAANAVRSKSMGMFTVKEEAAADGSSSGNNDSSVRSEDLGRVVLPPDFYGTNVGKSPANSATDAIVTVNIISLGNGPSLYVPAVTYTYQVPTRLLRNLLGSSIIIKASSVAVGMS